MHQNSDREIIQTVRCALEQKNFRLPDNQLKAFVERQFHKGRQFLRQIVKPSSPCYLFEKDMIGEKIQAFRRAFEYRIPETGFYYAVKSNNCEDVAKAVLEAGLGLDVSSGLELSMALDMDATDIVFSGPGKTNDELAMAVSNNDRVVVLMDSFGELSRLSRIATRKGLSIRAGVRLNTEPKGLWRKFGILPSELAEFIRCCRKEPLIDFQGLQFHSSWNMGPERQMAFIEKLGHTLEALPAEDRSLIRFIDIGGGYWPEGGEWMHASSTVPGQIKSALGMPETDHGHYLNPSTSIESFAVEISSAIKNHIFSRVPCRICFEPGRWICNDAMHILLTVIDKKADDLVITDGGTNIVGWERFETDYFPVLNLSRPAMCEKPCMILGSLCTPHDVWGYAYWGETIREGDILMIPTQGAYTYSLRQHFIKPVPEVIVYP